MNLAKFFTRVLISSLALGLVLGSFAAIAQASSDRGTSTAAPATDWGGCRYWVRPGDTLFRIAARYGVSWWYLAQINGLYNPNYIYVGMPLEVPCGGNPPEYPPPPPKECAPSVKYLVKPGDNLFRIALNFGTTINAIRDANNLWGRVLRAGTTLTIPCPSTVEPVVPATDNLEKATPTGPPAQSQLLPEPSTAINLQDNAIDPSSATIKLNESVVWVNQSQNTYTVVSGVPGQPNNFFTSPALPPGGTFVFKFEAAGSYSYYVSENTTLAGQVNVTP